MSEEEILEICLKITSNKPSDKLESLMMYKEKELVNKGFGQKCS